MFEVVVRLLPQAVLTHQWQPGKPLQGPGAEHGADPGRGAGDSRGQALTGQMFSLGVPSSCTIRSTWWISDVPGRRGLWASSSARMQPMALQRTADLTSCTSTEAKCWVRTGWSLGGGHDGTQPRPKRPLWVTMRAGPFFCGSYVLMLPLGIPGFSPPPPPGAGRLAKTPALPLPAPMGPSPSIPQAPGDTFTSHHMSMLVVCVVVPKSSSGARYLQTQARPLVPCSKAWDSTSLPDSLRQPGLWTANPSSDRLSLSAH